MIGALLTALFFGVTPVCAGRAIQLIGPIRANFFRLAIALLVLGGWTFVFADPASGPFRFFFAAGAVGFGLGGLSMFQALPLLGAPLSSLLVESGAALTAATLAWLWFADTLSAGEVVCCLVVLLGVGTGLAPYIRGETRQTSAPQGLFWAALAGLGQGISVTISRFALVGMAIAGQVASLPTAAFQRLLGGAFIALVALLFFGRRSLVPRSGTGSAVPPSSFADAATDLAGPKGESSGPYAARAAQAIPARRVDATVTARPWFWVSLNALFGPILGVTCMIWALQSLQPGIVQTVAATAPLISVPFARWLQGHRPPRLYYLGGFISIAGLAGLYLTG